MAGEKESEAGLPTNVLPGLSTDFPLLSFPFNHATDVIPGENGSGGPHPPTITTSLTSNSGFTTVLSSNPQPTSSEQTRDQGSEINQPSTVEASTVVVVTSKDPEGQPITSTLVVTNSPVAPSIDPSYLGTGTVAVSSSTSSPANSKDDSGQNSFLSNKSAVIGTFTTAGILLLILLGFCTVCIQRRNKKRREKELEREHDTIIADFAADVLSSKETASGGVGSGNKAPSSVPGFLNDEGDGVRPRQVPSATRGMSANSGMGGGGEWGQEKEYASRRESQGYGYGYGKGGGYFDSSNQFGGGYGYGPGEYVSDIRAPPFNGYPTPSPIPNTGPIPLASNGNGGGNFTSSQIPYASSRAFNQQSPYDVPAAEHLPNPYDGIETTPSATPGFLTADARKNSNVSLASAQSYGTLAQPPMQPDDRYAYGNGGVYSAAPQGSGVAGVGAGGRKVQFGMN
ncbi:hypothetical protein VKT23_012983 [Stygiomarasmius scandens]|uniref:Uncharacterized protein n=1 Tax=Marasmiellus scandens TaxID=2682957 RepID=A0ABR1J444_9AGAR